MAYNREDAEIYNLNKAMRAQYDSLYSTAPDVFAKKIKVLDEEINKKAIDVANETITKVKSKLQEKAEEKEEKRPANSRSRLKAKTKTIRQKKNERTRRNLWQRRTQTPHQD